MLPQSSRRDREEIGKGSVELTLQQSSDVELSRLHTRLRGRLAVALPTPLLFQGPPRRLAAFHGGMARPANLGAASQRLSSTEPWCCAAFSAIHTLVYKSIASLAQRWHQGYRVRTPALLRYTRVLHNTMLQTTILNIAQSAQRRRGKREACQQSNPHVLGFALLLRLAS